MIRVDRSYADMPTCLSTEADSDGTRETEKAKKYFQEQAKQRKAAALQPVPIPHKGKGAKGRKSKDDKDSPKFEFKVYKEAKPVLQELFNNKCGYCEIDYGGAPSDVEHFRPKAEIRYEQDGGIQKRSEGYYWLGADWDNLIYSCQHCNRGETHDHQEYPEAPIERRVSGKGNFFPLSDETKRLKPCDPVDGEELFRLLLDPCRDEPLWHLKFHTNGFVTAHLVNGQPSPKGQASIRHYGLSRVNLIDRRRGIANKLLFAIFRLNGDLQRLEAQPGLGHRVTVRATLWHIQQEYLIAKHPFLAMAWTLFRDHADLALLRKHFPTPRRLPVTAAQ